MRCCQIYAVVLFPLAPMTVVTVVVLFALTFTWSAANGNGKY